MQGLQISDASGGHIFETEKPDAVRSGKSAAITRASVHTEGAAMVDYTGTRRGDQ
ncbi:hypothetical protein SAMN05444004_112101 [Jannaschia faecimaris]|uniref:Uncharacterized protein n=1 Tax=Jannaschia faecimaris TaxID=1244108 RepID=A0A1H3SLU3_9RHOB|nr:hypothetical protein [Jannaschia faecimaris]SDZ38660.1 hypothetical protein SAMN05444004_112101 [Jannaschia faecimaris]